MENCFDANFVVTGAAEVVFMTTAGATSDDKVSNMTTLGFSVLTIQYISQLELPLHVSFHEYTWVPFHQQFYHRNSNSMKISFHSHLDSDTMIVTNVWIWHDSCAVVACAKICCDLMTANGITARWSFHRIWITGKNGPLDVFKYSYMEYCCWWRIHRILPILISSWISMSLKGNTSEKSKLLEGWKIYIAELCILMDTAIRNLMLHVRIKVVDLSKLYIKAIENKFIKHKSRTRINQWKTHDTTNLHAHSCIRDANIMAYYLLRPSNASTIHHEICTVFLVLVKRSWRMLWN